MPYESFTMNDFRGGLDLVSSKPNVQPGFSPNAFNVTIDEDGGIEKILGYSAFKTASAALHRLYTFRYSTNERIIGAAATAIYSYESDGTETTVDSSRTSNTNVTFTTVADTLYVLDDDNLLISWDGTNPHTGPHTAGVDTGPPLGRIIGTWNGRMYVVPATDQMKVVWSQPFTYTTTGAWPTDNNLRLSSLDGLGTKIVGGQAVTGGLLVFTDESVFKITSSDGAYTVLSNEGCSNADSIVMSDGVVYWVSKNGVYATDGNSIPQRVSTMVDTVFRASPNLSDAAGFARYGRYFASFRRSGSTNNFTLEFDPRHSVGGTAGSMMANELPGLSYAQTRWSDNVETYFIDHSATTRIRKAFSGGSAAGTDIDAYYETAPLDFGSQGVLKRAIRARIIGRGTWDMSLKTDYDEVDTDAVGLGMPSQQGDVWDTLVWGSGEWGGWSISEAVKRLTRRGRTFSFRFRESSSNTSVSRNLIEFSGQETGGAAIMVIEPHFVVNSRRMR